MFSGQSAWFDAYHEFVPSEYYDSLSVFKTFAVIVGFVSCVCNPVAILWLGWCSIC